MMKPWLPIVALSLFSAPFLQGCVVGQCANGDPNCVAIEPAVRFENAPKSDTAQYADGRSVRISSVNGDVKVLVGGSSVVTVTYQPFILDKKGNDANAKRAMETQLTTSTTSDATGVVIQTGRVSGASGGLGADITVTLPSTFHGLFQVDQGNGSVNVDLGGTQPTAVQARNTGAGDVAVNGAAGQLVVDASVGDVTVNVARWGAAGENGSVHTGNGAIAFGVPLAADGQMVLSAPSGMVSASGVPSGWAVNETSTSKAYTMNTGMGARVDVTNDFGDIALTAL